AAAGSQLKLTELVARLPEECLLRVRVGQVSVVGIVDKSEPIVLRGGHARGSRSIDKCVVTRGRQPLPIEAVRVAIEAAENPLQRSRARRCQPNFLCCLVKMGRVTQ